MNLRKMPTSKFFQIRVGITMGDPSGIGPAITVKAVNKLKGLAQFVIIGDRFVFNQAQDACLSGRQARRKTPACPAGRQGAKFIDLNNIAHNNFSFGKVKAEYGMASIEYLDKSVELITNKEIDCLVTCPVSKEAINLAGFDGFLGHTEYLACRTKIGHFAMMLLNRKLKFSLITRHIPLRLVASKLNKGDIYKTVLLTYKSLKELFLIRDPRIIVCGLNPHASDNGIIGDEENRIIRPALASLRKTLRGVEGPLPCDAAISKALQKKYDCVIAMYHDQALIPLKILGAFTGVNITLGLGFIRTSPLHGTAFDIAPNPALANPSSLIEAVKLAVRCALNQRKNL